MKMLITYALLADLEAAITAATTADKIEPPATTYLKIGTGRKLSRGHEIVLDEADREELLVKTRDRISYAQSAMKENPAYWRPLLAAWRAMEHRLITDWQNTGARDKATQQRSMFRSSSAHAEMH